MSSCGRKSLKQENCEKDNYYNMHCCSFIEL